MTGAPRPSRFQEDLPEARAPAPQTRQSQPRQQQTVEEKEEADDGSDYESSVLTPSEDEEENENGRQAQKQTAPRPAKQRSRQESPVEGKQSESESEEDGRPPRKPPKRPVSSRRSSAHEYPPKPSPPSPASDGSAALSSSETNTGRASPSLPPDRSRARPRKSRQPSQEGTFASRNPSLCGTGGCGCGGSMKGCTSWAFWSYSRRYSAHAMALAVVASLVAVGLTGMNAQWVFCTVGDYGIGALGYCQGGSCTVGVFYNLDIGAGEWYTNTMIGSGLLLLLSLGGVAAGTILLWTMLARGCNCSTGCQSPHRTLLYCFFDPHPDRDPESGQKSRWRLEQESQAKNDNRILRVEWEKKSRDEQDTLVIEAKAKTILQRTLDWTLIWAIATVIPVAAWVDATDAVQHLPYEVTVYGLPTACVVWFLVRRLFRTTVRGHARSQVNQGIDRAKEGALDASSSLQERGRRGVEGLRDRRDKMTPSGRRTARERDVG